MLSVDLSDCSMARRLFTSASIGFSSSGLASSSSSSSFSSSESLDYLVRIELGNVAD